MRTPALAAALLCLLAGGAEALAADPAIITPQPLPEEGAPAPEAPAADPALADEDQTKAALDLLMGQGGKVGGLTKIVEPYVIIVGGVEAEEVIQCAEDTALGACMGAELKNEESGGTRDDRVTTLALSRFGFRGQVNEHVYFESEFEANAGRYGTSAWEGQAAMQVRNQLIRYSFKYGRVEAGRITDPASIDFFSAHIADQLLMDTYIRTPLLSSGFNRGNGVLGVLRVFQVAQAQAVQLVGVPPEELPEDGFGGPALVGVEQLFVRPDIRPLFEKDHR